MNEQRTKVVLKHILEDLLDVDSFVQGVSQKAFEASPLLKKAVSMSLINIGELTRELPDSLKHRNPHIPWRSIIGLRNRAAHGYHTLDTEIMWNIANFELSDLERVVRKELGLL